MAAIVASVMLSHVDAQAAEWNRVAKTPYSPFMGTVDEALLSFAGPKASFDQVLRWMEVGYRFKYRQGNLFSPVSPQVTDVARQGDCKDKALWLAWKINDPTLRFVIGRIDRSRDISHAWLEWDCAGDTWVLDCTMSPTPMRRTDAKVADYQRLYSFARSGAYAHANVSVRREPKPIAARRRSSP